MKQRKHLWAKSLAAFRGGECLAKQGLLFLGKNQRKDLTPYRDYSKVKAWSERRTKTRRWIMAATLQQTNVLEFSEGDACPKHGTEHKKTYTFGSSMSAETDVCVFRGCRCAVAIQHDPIGVLPSVAKLCDSYDDAHGVGRLHAMMAAAKYR